MVLPRKRIVNVDGDTRRTPRHRHGYHGTTTRDLAQRSGLSVPGVYHYPSKQDILVELMTVIIDELLTRSHQALATAAPDPPSPGAA